MTTGKALERLIEQANHYYAIKRLAAVEKNPVEWRYTTAGQYAKLAKLSPSQAAKTANGRFLIAARSDVDYSGTIKLESGIGRSVCFDAKSTDRASLPLDNIKPHQVDTLLKHQNAGAIAGLMIHYTRYGRTFFVHAAVISNLMDAATFHKGRKSIDIATAERFGYEVKKSKFVDIDWYEVLR